MGKQKVKENIFQKLHEKGLENTNIEKLLDVVLLGNKIHMEIGEVF